ncbi:Uncharacterized conserved protein [Ekhidna lutea]|uniref:Uncharacterized conserved protein n=1 Tax=Ekhidna lutea TaxID=447679 RepID=A0A239JFC2_EKHLU|nr:DUF2075 domain-containing protein [Ekhidna lutea]SNT03993.1 Uncharacterized conserved protein [Ekhidna lutea]
MNRSYYSNSISDFLSDNNSRIIGELAINHGFDLGELQKNAWRQQIEILKDQLNSINGHIFFEFAIPRMGKRVDNVVIAGNSILILEFKIGEKSYPNHAIDQVLDYALDLKNFHEGSHDKDLIPILISSKANSVDIEIQKFEDSLFQPILCNSTNIRAAIEQIRENSTVIDPNIWSNSRYQPTPTIVEAAQALYKGHNVQEISRSDSGAINLSRTSDSISQIIEDSKANNKKSICFITGVPGAGKTLAGLNIANERMKADENENAVFLSGNGPLVQVLREALARDESSNSDITKREACQKANAFIQNIHHFRDEALLSDRAPVEKVVVFDEAQRAWTKEKSSSFMRRRGNTDFEMSEPDFLISILDRHDDWCTIVCLIGGGQEINTGEAGLEEWISALKAHYSEWNIYHSELIANNNDYLKSDELKEWMHRNSNSMTDLHLAVSVRSFRSEKVSDLVHSVLDGNLKIAQILHNQLIQDYPIKLTRDLDKAKAWIRRIARGNERIGLICSSGAKRLIPLGIHAKNEIEPPNWFLNPKEDVRSSNFLEEVATEFDIQGLEIDWAIVAWDGDLYHNSEWNFQNFKGTKWMNINKEIDRAYKLNAYRVLLTRARQGMVIYIPEGSSTDPTRPANFYDGTFNFLKKIGIKEI